MRFLLSRRWLLFALVVVVLCYATWWLGEWQFHRLADRKESNQIIRANEDRAPAPVADVLSPGGAVADEDEWRLVTATGTYDTDDTVIVRYRTRDGQSGVDAVVPLVTADGTALLVDRGWMAADNQGAGPTDLPEPPAGEVTVEGWARADATGDSTAVDGHSTRAISSDTIGPAIDRPVYGGFVELKSEDGQPADGLEPVELPELDNGPHFFYGLQWWFFGLLAICGFLYLAYDEWRGRSRGESSTREQVADERKQRRALKNAQKQRLREAYQRAYEEERRERQSSRSVPPPADAAAPPDEAGETTNAATRPNFPGAP
ncbi:SURF1 family protein [Nocardioides aquiterrae]|uniref:SURF1-like protein n=1 Tax=Nocardioides aquiterrae TaxID=203799 RepID=A0ABN1UQ11_9ACTN